MLLRNPNDLKPKLEKFFSNAKTAVLVEEGGIIVDGGYQPIIIHFFGDSKMILAKSIILAGATLPSDRSLGFPAPKFYVLSADDMNDTEMTAILESSETDKLDWFNKKRELRDVLLLNDILFEK